MAKEKILISGPVWPASIVFMMGRINFILFCFDAQGKGWLGCFPEVLGGLNIPHSPSEIVGGDGLIA